jgi:hypothetical protein
MTIGARHINNGPRPTPKRKAAAPHPQTSKAPETPATEPVSTGRLVDIIDAKGKCTPDESLKIARELFALRARSRF